MPIPNFQKILLPLLKETNIDGIELAELMMSNNLGVSTENIYELKKIDTDYFIEE